jgi:hypothetical protein
MKTAGVLLLIAAGLYGVHRLFLWAREPRLDVLDTQS